MTPRDAEITPVADVLGEWVARFSLVESSGAKTLLDKARLHILDGVGIALGASAASDDGFPAALASVIDAIGSAPAAQLFGRSSRAAPQLAALYNGALIHACEFDDTSHERVVHTEAFGVATALALGEATGKTSLDVAEAWCVAAEVALRLAAACDPIMGLTELGFHNSGVFGVYGAAAGAAKLLGLDAEQTAVALSLCTSFASGTTAGWGIGSGRNKCVQPGWAAFAGTQAAQLAQAGFVCAHTTIDAPTGLYASHLRDAGWSVDRVTDSLGSTWKLEQLTFKLHPAGAMLQAALDATQSIISENRARPEEIERVLVTVPPQYSGLIANMHYFDSNHALTDGYALTHSWPYAIACTLLYGHIGLEHLCSTVIGDSKLRALASKIDFEVGGDSDVPNEDQLTVVTVRTSHGEFGAEKGRHNGYPGSVTEQQIIKKFESNARLALSAKQVGRLRDCLLDLESSTAAEIALLSRP